MNVFISWSGNRSKAVADILRDWIKCVLQATRPWVSTRDIDRGSLWFSEINDRLKDTTVGIICLTQENKNRPWILFEAGALAKGLTSNRVCTLLVDLKPADLEDPLAQFNHTLPDRDSIWALIRTLNTCLGSTSLDERILDQVFTTYWIQFEEKFKAALKQYPQNEKIEPRSEKAVLEEILDNTRVLHRRIRDLEMRTESSLQRDKESETRRSRISNVQDARNFINHLCEISTPTETILRRLSDLGVPESFVVSEISAYQNRKESQPDAGKK